MSQFKPQLACDIDFSKVKWPLIQMPKLDGVRALNHNGTLTGRSLKTFKNKFVTERFSGDQFIGLDGELAFGDWQGQSLCRDTTGFVNRKTPRPGKPTEGALNWCIFDYFGAGYDKKPYEERLAAAQDIVAGLDLPFVNVVPGIYVYNEEKFREMDEHYLSLGFEGSIGRNPMEIVKPGRATVTKNNYLRLKQFIDFEVEIVELVEAMENQNEAKVNELGRTERSTHQENKVPKGVVGMYKGRALKDVEHDGQLIVAKDQIIDVGPGCVTHDKRKDHWDNPALVLKQVATVKVFPKGMKDKPRFPTIKHFRAEEDMSDD
jgi:DNA ligase 1